MFKVDDMTKTAHPRKSYFEVFCNAMQKTARNKNIIDVQTRRFITIIKARKSNPVEVKESAFRNLVDAPLNAPDDLESPGYN